jgi:hypothetical protein
VAEYAAPTVPDGSEEVVIASGGVDEFGALTVSVALAVALLFAALTAVTVTPVLVDTTGAE